MIESLEEASREALISEILSLREELRVAKAKNLHDQDAVDRLQRMAKGYYRAASDYVPPPEDDND